MSIDVAELRIRPNFARYRHVVGGAAVAAIVAGAGILVATVARAAREEGLSGGLIALALTALVIGAAVGWLALYFRNYCLIAGDGYFGRVNSFGRRIVWDRRKLKRIVFANVNYPFASPAASTPQMQRRYFFISDENRRLAVAPIATFDQTDLDELFTRLDLHPTKLRYLGPADVSRFYPPPLGFAIRHMFLLGLVGGLVATVVIIAVVVIATGGN